MQIAFCLFKYFPFGGLERDCLQIAEACLSRGHKVDIYTMAWQGDIPKNIKVTIIPASGFTNHSQRENFVKNVKPFLQETDYNFVVGFNKMPFLDIYYAADPCYAIKAAQRNFLYRLIRRCKSNLEMEQAVFGKDSHTHIFSISHQQQDFYRNHYGTDLSRFHFLSPGISKDRIFRGDNCLIRNKIRKEFSIKSDSNILLMVGSGYKRKGVDRSILALASLPPDIRHKTYLLIAGDGNVKPFKRLARRAGIVERVHFPGGRDDIPQLLAAADILLHPAYHENTGTVLIEALAAGLPVIVTGVCGYSFHIKNADAGKIIPSPYKQEIFNNILLSMLTSKTKEEWRNNGKEYVSRMDIFKMPEKAADIIENIAGESLTSSYIL